MGFNTVGQACIHLGKLISRLSPLQTCRWDSGEFELEILRGFRGVGGCAAARLPLLGKPDLTKQQLQCAES